MKEYIIVVFICLSSFIINAAEMNNNIIRFRRIDEEHRTLSKVVCIAVNSVEDIAIGFYDKHINVYDKDGNYKYGYTFNTSGSYAFEFDNLDRIKIFSVRSDTCYYFNTNAELLYIDEIINSAESNKYYRNLLKRKSFSINDISYRVTQSIGYIRVSKMYTNDNEVVIYEMGSHYFKELFKLLILALVVAGILAILITTIIIRINICKRL